MGLLITLNIYLLITKAAKCCNHEVGVIDASAIHRFVQKDGPCKKVLILKKNPTRAVIIKLKSAVRMLKKLPELILVVECPYRHPISRKQLDDTLNLFWARGVFEKRHAKLLAMAIRQIFLVCEELSECVLVLGPSLDFNDDLGQVDIHYSMLAQPGE